MKKSNEAGFGLLNVGDSGDRERGVTDDFDLDKFRNGFNSFQVFASGAGIHPAGAAALRGRFIGMYTMVSQAWPAAPGVTAGALLQRGGVGVALQAGGAALVIAMAAAAFRMTALRRHAG